MKIKTLVTTSSFKKISSYIFHKHIGPNKQLVHITKPVSFGSFYSIIITVEFLFITCSLEFSLYYSEGAIKVFLFSNIIKLYENYMQHNLWLSFKIRRATFSKQNYIHNQKV